MIRKAAKLWRRLKDAFQKSGRAFAGFYRGSRYQARLLGYKYFLEKRITRETARRLPPRPRILVSFTTTSYRVHSIAPMVRSLLHQSVPADEIILLLSEKGCREDEGVPYKNLPGFIRKKEKKGDLRIVYTENIGPYTKLIFPLKENYSRDCVIVTADDDAVYPYDWLEALYSGYASTPQKIAAHRCRMMWFQGWDLAPYKKWPLVSPENQGRLRAEFQTAIRDPFRDLFIFPTGMGGVLYSPRFFSELVFDKIFLKLSPFNDDIWFKFMTLINGVQVHVVGSRLETDFKSGWETRTSRILPLFKVNLVQGGRANDGQIKNVADFLSAQGLFDMKRYLIGDGHG